MKTTKVSAILVLAIGLMVCPNGLVGQTPIGTAFTYQGWLMDDKKPADNFYDFEFRLYDTDVNGTQEGNTIDFNDLEVTDGYFMVRLDFGNVFDGNERWLEITVRPADSNDPCDFVLLEPRMEVTLTPYAIHAKAAQNTDKVDGKHASDFMQNGAAAGGDLTGTYPNPTISSISTSLVPHIETGSYTGNGGGTRDIAVSFTPSAVIVFDTDYGHLHTIVGSGNNVQQGGASPPFSSGGTLGTNKFTVGDDQWSANANGYSYYWVAFGSGG